MSGCLNKLKEKHYYKVFGLNVVSDLILDQLLIGEDSIDSEVEIVHGKVPGEISSPIERTDSFQASKNEFLFCIDKTAKYYVAYGKRIVVEPFDGASSSSIALFLLGTVFGALLLQRGVLPIHGSAILIDGECVIFTGESGAGKSTLSLALREKGYPLLTDDVAALAIREDGTIWVQPGYPQQKVWKDCAEKMGVDVSGLSQIQFVREKYYLPIQRGFHEKPSRLKAVFEIKPNDCSDVGIKEFHGIDKLRVLMKNTYRVEYLHYFDLRVDHFKKCTTVAKEVSIYRLIRPVNQFTTDKQIELVKEILKSHESEN